LSERASEHFEIFFSFDASWIDEMDNGNCCFLSSWLVITSWLDGWIGGRSFLVSVHSSKMHTLEPNNLTDLNVIVIYEYWVKWQPLRFGYEVAYFEIMNLVG